MCESLRVLDLGGSVSGMHVLVPDHVYTMPYCLLCLELITNWSEVEGIGARDVHMPYLRNLA